MDTEQFKNLYNNLTNLKLLQDNRQQDQYLVEFDILSTKFAFYKNLDKHYICKFSFEFLELPQRVEIELFGKDIQFKIDDSDDNELIYDIKKFKLYFNPQFQLFKEAFVKFKQFLDNNNKIKQEQNTMSVTPLKTILNQQKSKQLSITIDNIPFLFNEIKNTFNDTFRVDFELAQKDITNELKYVIVIFKTFSTNNFYILNTYIGLDTTNLDNATKLSKEQFTSKYPTYIVKLNQAINTYLNMNH